MNGKGKKRTKQTIKKKKTSNNAHLKNISKAERNARSMGYGTIYT